MDLFHGEDTAPSDACIRRLIYHLDYKTRRGDYIDDFSNYTNQWLERLAKENSPAYTDLILPTPSTTPQHHNFVNGCPRVSTDDF